MNLINKIRVKFFTPKVEMPSITEWTDLGNVLFTWNGTWLNYLKTNVQNALGLRDNVKGQYIMQVHTDTDEVHFGYPVYAPNLNIKLFSQIADSTAVTATTTETTIIGAGTGTLIVPADGFKAGDTFNAAIRGILSAVNGETLQIKVKSGSVVLLDTGALTLPAVTSLGFTIDIDFVIRALGAATVAEVYSGLNFYFNRDTGATHDLSIKSNVNNTTFDTTIANTLDVTATWGTANAGNSIQTQKFTLHQSYKG